MSHGNGPTNVKHPEQKHKSTKKIKQLNCGTCNALAN